MDTSQLVNRAIDDLLDPSVKLSDALLKVKAIATLIGNENLKSLVKFELDGYYGENIQTPEHRRIGVSPRANLITAYGRQQQNNILLPVEYLGIEQYDLLTHRYLHQSLSELEHLVQNGQDTGKFDIPKIIQHEIEKKLYKNNGWHIYSAWQIFSLASVQGAISTIRGKILDILLEIKVEFGDNIPIQSLQQKQIVNQTIDKAMHSINVTNGVVNVSHGEASVQATNTGQGAINAATGSNISQTISSEQSTSLQDLIQQIEQIIADESAFNNQREEMGEEIKRVNVQLKKEEPKKGIIKRSIESLTDLASEAAGVTAGHALFELLKHAHVLAQ